MVNAMQNTIILAALQTVCCVLSYLLGKQSTTRPKQHKPDDGPIEMEHRHGE